MQRLVRVFGQKVSRDGSTRRKVAICFVHRRMESFLRNLHIVCVSAGLDTADHIVSRFVGITQAH
jgi:hypothetical protein